ncbi:hypothetical protein [Saccharopolyspora phatthalungensis]|uniref:Uncharacterized protein n=1 Tax=Saccharopolyspora phatthalungensis TaxID=664693 RepID=A0A840Q353_9PSEU|nr:hypothetical protein [Saccharopolyspora phatthalungensis]MBB5154031.1 hypothetical protein [Saccharopolyspora phatthalungensis]
MKPVVLFELTGQAIKTILGLLVLVVVVLALVWLLIGPAYAIGGGIGVIVLVRGLYALFAPSRDE